MWWGILWEERLREVRCGGLTPVPRQQRVEFVALGVAGDDALQHVGEIGERLDAV